MKKYNEWTLIDWDGNKDLGYKCYRKSFRSGYVSIGVGEFDSVVFSYGRDSESSFSSTRSRLGLPAISEAEAMRIVDIRNGYDFPHSLAQKTSNS